MSAKELFQKYFSACPLVAIIRGVRPVEVEDIGQAIFDAGIRIIEVPLNSPDPLASIGKLAARLGDRALVGAGTVLDPAAVADVKAAGGELVVSPNMNPRVIEAAVGAGLVSCPGVFTPTEAFRAIEAGAHVLKLFPAEAASPAVVKAQRAVLPKEIPLLVVGGVRADTMQPWLGAGADGFGIGSGIYVPGQSAAATGDKARSFVRGITRG